VKRTALTVTAIAVVAAIAQGCGPNIGRMQKQVDLMQQLMKEPDLPQWYTQRQAISQATGERVFDKSFDRVFDSLTVAVASLGAHVDNMERQSGYISARGTLLPPELTKSLRHQSLVEYCRHHNYDPDLLEKRGAYDVDPDAGAGAMERMGITMTLSLVRQSDQIVQDSLAGSRQADIRR